tara:strand:- start:391 stop:510 length:120 start_codon:yes stop_codon:yes gene_type:complete
MVYLKTQNQLSIIKTYQEMLCVRVGQVRNIKGVAGDYHD